MPSISGPDANVITINGRRINAQGIGRLRDSVTTEDAAAKLKGAGMDEMILSVRNGDGKAQRMLVWGDELDFRFRENESQPDVRINGQPAKLLAFDDEPNTFWEAGAKGVVDGVRDAVDAISAMAKNSIQGVAVASGAAFLGSAVLVVASKGAAVDLIRTALVTFGPGLASTAGVVSASAVALVVLAGAIKGAFGALTNQPKMEVVAAVLDDAPPSAANIITPDTPPTVNAPAANTPKANGPKPNAPKANGPVSNAKANAPAPQRTQLKSRSQAAAPAKSEPAANLPLRRIHVGGEPS